MMKITVKDVEACIKYLNSRLESAGVGRRVELDKAMGGYRLEYQNNDGSRTELGSRGNARHVYNYLCGMCYALDMLPSANTLFPDAADAAVDALLDRDSNIDLVCDVVNENGVDLGRYGFSIGVTILKSK